MNKRPSATASATALATTEHESQAFALHEIKTLDSMQGTFEGYLAVFSNEDHNGDIIEPGSFKRTLADAQERKIRDRRTWQYPLLWMHDVENPCGGFDAQEDQRGLYIKGQCDLNTEIGKRAFSGMVMGYMSQLSIGYDAVKSQRDTKGIRHLTEIRLWEGSVVTTGYAANDAANIMQTKTKESGASARKGASGKTTWPLASRDRPWDAAAAHARIISWATNDDDTLNVSKMASVHFWYDTENSENITAYKLLFCDVVGGEVQAIPRGIFAVAGVLSGARGGADIGEAAAVKARVATYYRRMAREFDDESVEAPWAASKTAWRREIERKQWGGLQTMTRVLAAVAALSGDIETLLETLTETTGVTLDVDAQDVESVGDQLTETKDAHNAHNARDVQPAVKILLDNMPGLPDALTELGTSFATFNGAGRAVLSLLGLGSADTQDDTARPILELKRGAQFSNANREKILVACHEIEKHTSGLKQMVEDVVRQEREGEPNDNNNGTSTGRPGTIARMTRTNASHTEPGSRATTPQTKTVEPGLDTTTLLSEMQEGAAAIQLSAILSETRDAVRDALSFDHKE